LQFGLFEIASFIHFDNILGNLSCCKFFFEVKFDGCGSFLCFVLPIEFGDEISFLRLPYEDNVLVLVLVVLLTSNEVSFNGTPFEGSDVRAFALEGNLLVWNVDNMDAIFINYGHVLTSLWREFNDLGRGVLWEVCIPLKGLDLVVCVAAVEGVQDGTLVSERYKLQLLQGLVFLVLVGQRRLHLIFVHKLTIGLFLEVLLGPRVVV
jgi:hypothetical protein